MRKACTLFLSLLAVPYCRAQYPARGFPVTPAQSDWTASLQQDFAVDRGAMGRPSGENISVARLRHNPPGKARSAFSRGLKCADANEFQLAVAAFQEAVAIDPEFSEAHGNMGVEYTALGLFDEAASAFRRAVELDPSTGIHHANLAYALLRLERDKEAEREAQAAVDLDPTYTKGQYLLGFLEAHRPGAARQAEQHLGYAARELPEAHFVLAELYFNEGNGQIAGEELDKYRKAIELRTKEEANNLAAKSVK